MKRRLWFLNQILLALLAVIAVRFQQVRQEALERAARNLNQPIKPEPMPPLPPVTAPAPLVAANYADVAIRMLLSRDRNPAVILDPVVPPPVKPMPPLPVAYGAMFFGEPSIILGLHLMDLYTRIHVKSRMRLLQDLCQVIGIALLDHIILGDDRNYSFADFGWPS